MLSQETGRQVSLHRTLLKHKSPILGRESALASPKKPSGFPASGLLSQAGYQRSVLRRKPKRGLMTRPADGRLGRRVRAGEEDGWVLPGRKSQMGQPAPPLLALGAAP